MASSIYPSLGLYWIADVDPTVGAGVAGALNQLLFRTDTNVLYRKSGSANTDWTPFGIASGSFAGKTIPVLQVPNVKYGFWFRDDLVNRLISDFLTAGAGANGNPTGDTQHIGTIQQSVGAAGVDAALISMGTASATPVLLGGGTWEVEGLSRTPTLSNNVNNIVTRWGLNDSTNAADVVDGVYLEYDFASFGDHKFRLCAASNSIRTKVDTGIVNVAGRETSWEVDVNEAGTVATATIEGVASANPVNSNIPTAAGRQTTVRLQAVKQLGAGTLTVIHDFYEVRSAFTAAR